MAQITNGLTNGGQTAHYAFSYDSSLQQTPGNPAGPEPARTNAVIAAAEGDFTQMTGWFGGIALDVNVRITVNVTQNGGGAAWSLSGGNLTVTINPNVSGSTTVVRYLLVAEMVEQFMRAQGLGWYGNNTEGSEGEGLSRFLSMQFLLINGLGNPPGGFANSNAWLSSVRADFVNNIVGNDDGPDAVTGCSTLFIWYLFAQLGFSLNQIVAAGAATLGGVYRNLTGDTADPFPFFKQLVDTAFPGTAIITSGNLDNPFPVGILSFWVDKSTFGRDEVTDVIAAPTHGAFNNAFWLVLEGFNIQNFTALGIAPPSLSGPFASMPGLALSSDAAGTRFEDTSNTRTPQRIRFPYDIGLQTSTLAAFPAPGGPADLKVLNAQARIAGNALPGASAVTEFELVGGADPYFTNIDPGQGNVFWLSQDVRVFTATPGLNSSPVPGAPAFSTDSFTGAYSYVQSLLGWLNDPNQGFTTGATDPFTSGVIPQQGPALTGDSSVTPFTVRPFPLALFRNYNFAIARVRLRGAPGPADAAQSVKVFFRMWSTQSADTDFQPGSTYLSNLSGGRPQSPRPAPDGHTFPFFATGNAPDLGNVANPEYGISGVNNRTVQIASGDQSFAYYGCFLNVYDPANTINGSAVQALMAGTHHCLVAEIAYDEAPILNGNGVTASPENSDKLAQRNLQVTHSDNPGPADSHRVPQTFDIRPSAAITTSAGDLLDYPDELMIDWGGVPVGSTAHIYWPQVDATEVLDLARRLFGTSLLTASDSHTIECTVARGVTYVPIPTGSGENFAGLLTIDLPTTVTTGQEFNIIVRRVSTRRRQVLQASATTGPRLAAREEGNGDLPADSRRGKAAGAITTTPDVVAAAETAPKASLAETKDSKENRPSMRNWRYVVGTFQVKIPVSTAEVMLRPDENTLAIIRWRLTQMATSNRWHPVLSRYAQYLAARIDALGGDSTSIQPSPDGVPLPTGTRGHDRTHTGRVRDIAFDCNGEFEGFTLEACCGEHHSFEAREPGVRDLVLRSCRERLTLVVVTEGNKRERICRILVHC